MDESQGDTGDPGLAPTTQEDGDGVAVWKARLSGKDKALSHALSERDIALERARIAEEKIAEVEREAAEARRYARLSQLERKFPAAIRAAGPDGWEALSDDALASIERAISGASIPEPEESYIDPNKPRNGLGRFLPRVPNTDPATMSEGELRRSLRAQVDGQAWRNR